MSSQDDISRSDDVLYSVMWTNNADVMRQIMRVCFPDAGTVLDLTYGHGGFWDRETRVAVTGNDIKPDSPAELHHDFRAMPLADGSHDVTVLDIPYHTGEGRGKRSVMGGRFDSYRNVRELDAALRAGCAEARRLGRLGAVVKVQDYICSSHVLEMTQIVRAVLGKPYETVTLARRGKITAPNWDVEHQLSAYRNAATFLVYRWGSQTHKRRKPASNIRVLPRQQPVTCSRCGSRMARVAGSHHCQRCVTLPGMGGNG